MNVRFVEQDATVRYLPGQVTLHQILKRYESTPFGVTLAAPVVTIAHTGQAVLRGWTERTRAETKQADSNDKAKVDTSLRIQLFVETVIEESRQVGVDSAFLFADPPAEGLAARGEIEETDVSKKPTKKKLAIRRFVARLYETVALKAGDRVIPVNFKITATDANSEQHEASGKLEVVLRTPPARSVDGDEAPHGVALIDGSLDLRLGHLCDQARCIEHFYKSLSAFTSFGAVDPHPSLEQPSATAYLRAGQAIDIWSLREILRDQSIELARIVPRDLRGYRLRVELQRWRDADASAEVQQCFNCRDTMIRAFELSPLIETTSVSGGGVNFTPKRDDVDLVEILEAIAETGVAPQAVWLVPAAATMPKASPPSVNKPDIGPKSGGSQSHPVVEFDFAHKCDAGPTVLAMMGQPSWASRTQFESDKMSTARALIADRQFAALTPLLSKFRSAGQMPQRIRLSKFGDVRIRLEFAHICGDIVYSKPPKPKKKKGQEKADEKKKQEEEIKPTKPFVPKPLRPADTSNGRRAIKTAIESVSWIKDAVFFDYHTKFEFRGGPRIITLSFQPTSEGTVRLDELISALRTSGFPPKSVMVSRRFPGIPFSDPLPGELLLTDRDGKRKPLAALKQPDRPLALAFVSLKCKRHKKYEADPKFYKYLRETIDKYKDRVDFVTVGANPDDKFEDVVAFLEETKLPVPLHDVKGSIRAALNAQETPAPHLYIFDRDGLFRYAGDPHDNWEKPDEEKEDYLVKALELVLAGQYAKNGAAFYNKSLCNCSHPKCKCPKCGCGPSCRCAIKH